MSGPGVPVGGRLDLLLDRLGYALRARVEMMGRAEAQRASFVFSEGPGPARNTASDGADPAWTLHLARAVHAATEPAALDLLAGLRREDLAVEGIARTAGLHGDRLAAGAWVGDLAAVGLVARDLETDRVSLAPLGRAIVELLEAAAAAAAGEPGP